MPVPNSNRSSSPVSSTPHSSSRNSDPNSTTRRSISGNPSHRPSVFTNPRNLNPTTPANSPSGFGRRISGGYGGTDEKENDQSIKPVKLRSSATGSKNFMAPTISAACKSTPSPRKMLLEERNELVQTSIPNDLEPKKVDLEQPFVDKAIKRVRFADSTIDSTEFEAESVLLHSDCVVTDMSAKIECSFDSASHIDVPLDADLEDKAIKRVRFADSTIDSTEFEAESVLLHSDCVVTDMSAKIECSFDSASHIDVPLDADLEDKAIKRVRFADSTSDLGNSTEEFKAESVLLHSDCVVTDMSAKIESSSDSVSRIIDPLDANPSFLPYDPKTNYLSPRPQFLHYKPNPRIAALINKEKGMDDEGVKRLEDDFTSFESNSSDTTDSAEEILSSDDLHRDSEASSAEIDEPSKAGEDIHGSESLISGDENVYESSGMVVEGKGKRGLLRRLGFIFMLVVLLISCYSISVTYYSPDTADSTILKALNIPQLNVDLAKANFNLFSHRFKQFSIDTMSRLSLPINNTGQGGQLSPLQFMNLTELQNDILVGGCLHEGSQKSPEWNDLEEECRVLDDLEQENRDWDDLEEENTDEIVESFEETLGEYVSDSSTEHEPATENDLLLIGALPTGLASETICNQEPHVDTESQDYVNPEHSIALALEVHKEDNYGGNVNLDNAVEPLKDYEAIAPVHEVSIKNIPDNLEECLNLESNANEEHLSEDIKVDTVSDAIHPPIVVELPCGMEPSTHGNSRNETSAFHLAGNAAFVLSVVMSSTLGNSRTETSANQLTGSAAALILAVLFVSFAAFLIRKKGSDSKRNLRVVDTNELLSKKPVLAATSAVERLYQEKLSSSNLPTLDDIQESCSYEMSSYRSHNNNNMLKSAKEAQSGETRPRKYSKRESFSSSDFSFGGSTSYGSFTTYERIPVKNATGDDEVVTPVRRSSRLRSHVTS